MISLPAKVQPGKPEEASLNGIDYQPPAPIPHERHSKAWREAQEPIKQPRKKKEPDPPKQKKEPKPAQVKVEKPPRAEKKIPASQSKVLMRMLEGFTKDMLAITKKGDIKKKILAEMTKEGADPDFVKWFAKEIMGLAKKYFDVTSTEMKINAGLALQSQQSQHGAMGGQTNIFIIKGLHDTNVIDISPTRDDDQQEVTDAQFEAIGLTAEDHS